MHRGWVKGSKHTDESRRRMSEARRGTPHSAERKAKISAANKGKVRARRYACTCPCGKEFMAGAANARFCSAPCKRASYGHGLRHAPRFAHFPQCCAICSRPDDLVGDHDHDTGEPRGILCRNCNLAIGNMHDSPQKLRAAADYLERAQRARLGGTYVCGPMSGLPESNYPAFHRAAAQIRAMGCTVYNPAENPEPPCKSWLGYMRMAVAQVARADRIVLLPGWRKSKGARVEFRLARGLGLQIMTIEHALSFPAEAVA